MIFQFPDLDTLQLALTSGELPPEVAAAPARAGFAEDGSVFVETGEKIPKAAQAGLKRLGVQAVRSLPVKDKVACLCWPQILPLRRVGLQGPTAAHAPVLFEIEDPAAMPTLVGEMLRLGNDRQGYRYVSPEKDKTSVLLRVNGPPYYSLLRAVDRHDHLAAGGPGPAPRAYLEQAPRVWVEVGHRHPLMELIQAPAGRLLILRPDREWLVLDDAPFHDIYDVLEFQVPGGRVDWREAEARGRLQVPLRLMPGGGSEAAELWVLRDDPVHRLDAFVREASDHLLARLSFAVAEAGGATTVVLRVRPSRQAPPVLVLPALAFRPYLKLPNLFLPVGSMIQPPLRRDAVRKLLAENPDELTWLHPEGDGAFRPESLPDAAFRPLPDWIDYVFTRDRAALQGWVQASVFDFDRFICRDDQKPRDKKPRDKASRDKDGADRQNGPGEVATTPVTFKAAKKKFSPPEDAGEDSPLDPGPKFEPSELQRRQQELERQFMAVADPALDAPGRKALWPELAWVYAAQNNMADATVCWMNALWDAPPESRQYVRAWKLASVGERTRHEPFAALLDRVLAKKDPSPADVRVLASSVADAAGKAVPDREVVDRLGPIQARLQEHEGMLPVRAVWLTALALADLAGGDVLSLARARDRVLERLFKHGLTIEQDLPGFLRFSGAGFSDRFRAFRDWLAGLPDRVHRWLERVHRKGVDADAADNKAFADLILSFGFARLGEKEQSDLLRGRARKVLGGREDVYGVLLEAFGYRIDQALQGTPPTGPLPADQHEYLEKEMDRLQRYAVDRLRQHSRILEPHEKVNPYRMWQGQHSDELQKELAFLPDLRDNRQLEEKVHELFARYGAKGKEAKANRAVILKAALELSPRVGQKFAAPLLEEVTAACQQFKDPVPQAELLEKGLFVAAHFDQPAYVQQFVGEFEQLLKALQDGARKTNTGTDTSNLQALEALAGQSFRGLRKLGMRDAIHRLLAQVGSALTQGQPVAKLRERDTWPQTLRALLHVAAGWYYFGMDEEARPIMDEARRLLFEGKLERTQQRKVACAYVETLGQAPIHNAIKGIEELLGKLEGVYDTFTTNKYYGLSQLEVLETVVRTIVTEDFAVGSQARRWLDDDEFLVRRRIHQDVQAAVPGG